MPRPSASPARLPRGCRKATCTLNLLGKYACCQAREPLPLSNINTDKESLTLSPDASCRRASTPSPT
eukprot:6180001-Pleurochrysis_carterae.AAC.5